MPPAYVKAYVKRDKTDAADAEAIAEAVTRHTIAFRGGRVENPASRIDAARDPRSPGQAADHADQRGAWLPRRVRDYCG